VRLHYYSQQKHFCCFLHGMINELFFVFMNNLVLYAFFKNIICCVTCGNIMHTVVNLDIKHMTSQFKSCKSNSTSVSC
jgi:hypothetical protein